MIVALADLLSFGTGEITDLADSLGFYDKCKRDRCGRKQR